ncbi:MAG TPA: von Willebrand factor type A domain-containing protein [Kofleriaceae bacterium]|nr:von Willebrand factor type A domain-containing protein [Kofleriaceae bacterium]
MRRGRPSQVFELFVIIAVVLGIRQLSSADALGTIDGTITDGRVAISGASVRVVCGGVPRAAATDASGHFSLGGLPPGSCTLTATAPGHGARTTAVTVTAGKTTSVSLMLAIAPQNSPKDTAKTPLAEPKPDAPLAKESPAPPPVVAMKRKIAGRMPASPSPAAGPMVIDNDPAHNTEQYAKIDDNPFFKTRTAPLSTFSADVDTASYSNVRRFLKGGSLPPKDAVRIEELINYFTYDLPPAQKGDPFSITTEVGPSPWNTKHQLVRIGLKAPVIDDRQVPPRNLTFLLDVSGSMMDANKLPLLKQAMGLLIDTLRPQDKVSIVVYAGNTGIVLTPTSGREKDTIRQAVFSLEAGGSTNGAAGIQLAYDMAEKSLAKGAINRVILCTDGDFNVGITSEGDLARLIEKERERGIFLTVLGFGMGNTKDSTMEKLADRGNGNYAYIDSIAEARKVLVKEAGATLVTVAKDVKLQVEFNPETVAGYRLVGYENRIMRHEDFNDDKKDAGDIGAGHSVTAIYEIVPAGMPVPTAGVDDLKYQGKATPSAAAKTGELLTVKIRYKAPSESKSKLLSRAVQNQQVELAKTSIDYRWATAIAGFGMMLRDSQHRGNLSWKQVETLAEGSLGKDAEGYRAEALKLIRIASKLQRPANAP